MDIFCKNALPDSASVVYTDEQKAVIRSGRSRFKFVYVTKRMNFQKYSRQCKVIWTVSIPKQCASFD